jgi:hypothetical protein
MRGEDMEKKVIAEMNFTEGKWIVGVSYVGGWPVYRLRDMRSPNDEVEVQANVHLIAAAPELYRACEAMMNAWIQPTKRSMHDVKTDMDKAYEQAKAALSAAGGGQ